MRESQKVALARASRKVSNNIRNKGGDSINSRMSSVRDEKEHGDVEEEEEEVSKKKNEGEVLEL